MLWVFGLWLILWHAYTLTRARANTSHVSVCVFYIAYIIFVIFFFIHLIQRVSRSQWIELNVHVIINCKVSECTHTFESHRRPVIELDIVNIFFSFFLRFTFFYTMEKEEEEFFFFDYLLVFKEWRYRAQLNKLQLKNKLFLFSDMKITERERESSRTVTNLWELSRFENERWEKKFIRKWIENRHNKTILDNDRRHLNY